jgi:hypothetical protein
MRRSRWIKLLAAGLAAGSCLCLAAAGLLYARYGDFLPSFPEAFFGQLTLARATRPIQANEYQSAELVLGRISAREVERAEFVVLGEDALFWQAPYPGFARATLSTGEVQALLDLLGKAQFFQSPATGSEYRCLERPAGQAPRLAPCAEGAAWMDQYAAIQGRAHQQQAAGVLLAYLRGGGPEAAQRKVVEVRIYRSAQGLAFEPREQAGSWWLKGVSAPSELVEALVARAQAGPAPLLWPEMTADAANARAGRILGQPYQRALAAARQSPQVRAAFGEHLVLRPALGASSYASWMDSTSISLTLAAAGTSGEGAVLVRGFAPFDASILSWCAAARWSATERLACRLAGILLSYFFVFSQY